TQEEAERFINAYFARYPKVRDYLEGLKRQAAEQGYVETLLGRRRYFPELAPGAQTSFNQRRASERMAVNAPIQGSAADIIKIAMCRLHSALKARRLRTRLILQVHDELVLEVPEARVEEARSLVKEGMETAYPLEVPLEVEVGVGRNWLEAKA
ncbi:MAG: DNA polymerase I, partial [Thermus sp.]